MKFRDFFYYNKSDRNVILVLLAIGPLVSLTALFFLGNDEISVGEGYQGTAQLYK